MVFYKPLEDAEASGWTQAVERSNNHFSTVGPKMGLAMVVFSNLNICVLGTIPHITNPVSQSTKMSTERSVCFDCD